MDTAFGQTLVEVRFLLRNTVFLFVLLSSEAFLGLPLKIVHVPFPY